MTSQMESVSTIQMWLENEVDFRGRTDEDFLLMFLRSCDFDLELTKNTLILYYQNRVKYPKWWANRNLNHSYAANLFNQKVATVLIDEFSDQPTLYINILSRYGTDSSVFDNILKLLSVQFEILARRSNCQMNGCIAINDCQNIPTWLPMKMMWPSFIKSFIYSFNFSMPIKLNKVIFVHAPAIFSVIFKLALPFLSDSLKKKVYFCSDWFDVRKHVPLKCLPEECGGHAGPLQKHEEAFDEELMSFNDYLINDDQYGYSPH